MRREGRRRGYVWAKSDEGVLRPGSVAGPRVRPEAGTRVRQGRSQIRDPGPAQRRARPRLRGHAGARGSLPWVLLSEPRLGLPDVADARGPRLRGLDAAG